MLTSKKTDSSVWLHKLDFELTERCNNNCIHCCINLPENDLAAKARELSREEIKDIIRQAVELGCLSIRFTGGEPFLREDFEELYVFTRRQGVKVTIFTNATLLTAALAAVFKKIPPLEPIEVSVYGMKKDSYEKVTRTLGSFAKAWEGINLLLKEKIPFVVKGAYLPPNKHELEEFSAWTRRIPAMKGRAPAMVTTFNLRCRKDNATKDEQIRNFRISPEEAQKFFHKEDASGKIRLKEFCSKFIGPTGDKVFACGAGIGNGCVDAYGYLHPCLMLKDPKVAYNLKGGQLREAMMEFFPQLRRQKSQNHKFLSRCAKCFLQGLCRRCPAHSWLENGRLDSPVGYLCSFAHLRAASLGLLSEREKAWRIKNWRDRVNKFVAS